jgi:hypothetical protein
MPDKINKSRFSAKEAKILSEKAKQEIALKNSVRKEHQKKLKKVFQNAIEAAINGRDFLEYSDEDADFLNFCYKEFDELSFPIEICGTTPDHAIERTRRSITDLEEEIEAIGNKTTEAIEDLAEKINELITNHPEYIQVYEWLIDAYEGRALIEQDWYDWDYKKLPIVHGAERDKLIDASVLEFQWQGKLKKIVSDIKRIHETSALQIQRLKNQISDLKENEIFVDEIFRILHNDDDIDSIELLSIRIYWDDNHLTDFPEETRESLVTPSTLYWLSSHSGQRFLSCVDQVIQSSSENGKDEALLRLFSDGDDSFVLQFGTEEISAPHPDIVLKIYQSLGFETHMVDPRRNPESFEKNDFTDLRIAW